VAFLIDLGDDNGEAGNDLDPLRTIYRGLDMKSVSVKFSLMLSGASMSLLKFATVKPRFSDLPDTICRATLTIELPQAAPAPLNPSSVPKGFAGLLMSTKRAEEDSS